jgi:hypothetical protein
MISTLRLTPQVRNLFARTKLELLPEDYYVVHLPLETRPIPGEWYRPATTRFAVFIRAPRGITLIVGRRKWLRMRNLFTRYTISEPMRVVTLDAALSLDVYGYLAAVSEVLAAGKISVVPIGSFDRDHIVVKKRDLPRAIRLLRQFLASCKK